MLSESLQELLSAYVDGELAPAEYERVMAALRDSAVARDYVKQLRDMSAQIKGLPRLIVPTSFSAHYLKHNQHITRRRKAWRWGALGAAAAALIAGVSMWLSQPQPIQPQPGPGFNDIATKIPDKVNPAAPSVSPEKRHVDATWLADLGHKASEWTLEQLDRTRTELSKTVRGLESALVAWDKRRDANEKGLLADRPKTFGDPFVRLEPDPNTAYTIRPDEFDLTAFQTRLSQKGLFVADMTCTDTLKSLTRLTEACKQHGIALVLDEAVQLRVSKRLPSAFAIYLENVNEETVSKLWATLSELDHWHGALSTQDASCLNISLTSMKNDEETRRQFARSLGFDPQKFVTPKAAHSPVAPQAVVVEFNPNRLAASISPNVRDALQAQGGPKADAVSLVFKLRSNK